MRWFTKNLISGIFIIVLCGCAASRSVVKLDQVDTSGTSVGGPAVLIDKIDDNRRFEASPSDPDTPSLHAEDIGNAGIKARAIGRKRGGFGAALGDVLLPENQTVSQVITEAVENGFRLGGYRVVHRGDAGVEGATLLTVSIRQFWSWFQPGFWHVTVHNRCEIVINGSLPVLAGGRTVTSETKEEMGAVFESDWQKITSNGLKELTRNVTAAVVNRRADTSK